MNEPGLWNAARSRLPAETSDELAVLNGKQQREGLTAAEAERLTDSNKRRTVYGYISRRKLDGVLALFDFPSPNNTSEQRLTTNVPLQRLFFMNSALVAEQAKALAARLKGEDRARINQAYQILFSRAPSKQEMEVGLEFLRQGKDPWPQYAQALLSSNEFYFVQ